MFNQREYENEYQRNNYKNVPIRYRKDDENTNYIIETMKQYAKDNNTSMQKAIIKALEYFLTKKGYL